MCGITPTCICAQQERLAKEQAQQRAQLLAQKLLSLGIDPDNF
ncbi:MAG TPA: hypothetical protein V6D25_28905 [Leptolyngbyaceae cyanobacterium]